MSSLSETPEKQTKIRSPEVKVLSVSTARHADGSRRNRDKEVRDRNYDDVPMLSVLIIEEARRVGNSKPMLNAIAQSSRSPNAKEQEEVHGGKNGSGPRDNPWGPKQERHVSLRRHSDCKEKSDNGWVNENDLLEQQNQIEELDCAKKQYVGWINENDLIEESELAVEHDMPPTA